MSYCDDSFIRQPLSPAWAVLHSEDNVCTNQQLVQIKEMIVNKIRIDFYQYQTGCKKKQQNIVKKTNKQSFLFIMKPYSNVTCNLYLYILALETMLLC